jgi:CheY-like chemotaxis protein
MPVMPLSAGQAEIMPDKRTAPVRVLVVEDEMMVAMLVEDMLTDLGYEVVTVASGMNSAIEHAERTEFDLAILDLNLNGEKSYPVAEALRTRNVPFLFATGYGEGALPENFRDVPTLQKPFVSGQLKYAIDSLVTERIGD